MGRGSGAGRGRGAIDLDDISFSQAVGAGCCFCILFITSVVLVAVSFATIGPLEYGLKFNTLNREIEQGKVYTNGRYFVGLARNFIKYPSVVQNVLFANDANADAPAIAIRVTGEGDSGGGTLRIDVSFQYLMVPSELDALFRDVEQNFQSRISDEARDVLAATAQRFELNDYFTQRPAVRTAFLQEIAAPLRSLHVLPIDLQVRRIVLSDNVEQSILNKAVSRQDVLLSEQTNQRLDLEAQQNIVRGSGTEAIRSRNAAFAAQAAILVQGAQANATAISVGASAFAASRLQNGTGFSTQELLHYRWLQDVVKQAPEQSSITTQLNPTALL